MLLLIFLSEVAASKATALVLVLVVMVFPFEVVQLPVSAGKAPERVSDQIVEKGQGSVLDTVDSSVTLFTESIGQEAVTCHI